MTDSGGFQVFSLGFGRDYGLGKIKAVRSIYRKLPDPVSTITAGQQPSRLTIADDGVTFTSPKDGCRLFLGPAESTAIQQKLGADIIFAFDEPTSPVADESYTEQSLARTHRWAKQCLEAKTSDQALFGIVQGGKFKHLRQESARVLGALPFDGFGIGGEYGDDKENLKRILTWSITQLPPEKPRHVLGIGRFEDIPTLIKAGTDLFDCIVPTHYARHGTAFVSPQSRRRETKAHRLDLTSSRYLTDQQPLDPTCSCAVCAHYRRSYLSHLIRAHEISGLSLLTFHNLHFFNACVASLRNQIKSGTI